MKKIAFFVEGETEQEFIERLLREVAGSKNISITSFKFGGGSKNSPRIARIIAESQSTTARYEALIYVSSTDNRVASDISDQQNNLKKQNFAKVIGLRDLRGAHHNRPFTHADLPNVERASKALEQRCLPLSVKIVIAVMEIEAWFLAETNHYECIDSRLTQSTLLANVKQIGFDPYKDDMTLRLQPAEDLAAVYQLVSKNYTKRRRRREETIGCLDYANIYLGLSHQISKLNELITEIDVFLT